MNTRIVTEQELEIRKGEIILSFDDMAEIISIKDLVFKFLDKSVIELRLLLWTWLYKWKESEIYNKIDWIKELKESIDKTEKNMKEYKSKQK